MFCGQVTATRRPRLITQTRVTSKERDAESGLDYFGARYFSSAQGRFTSPDQPFIDWDIANPQSWNLYSYGRNNPLINIDPTGQSCVSVSHSDGSFNQGDDGDGKGCEAAGVSPTKDQKPPAPNDTSELTRKSVEVTGQQGSFLEYTKISLFGTGPQPNLLTRSSGPFNPPISVYVAPAVRQAQPPRPKPSLAACVLAPHDFIQMAFTGPSDASDPLVGNNNAVPTMNTNVVARKASSPRGTKQSVGNSGQFNAQFGGLAANTLANVFADCALMFY